MGLLPLFNHSELFLEYSHNSRFWDVKVNQDHPCEIYPVAKKDGIHIHFIYPPVFKNTEERNLCKLNLLKQLKQSNKNYFIKGTTAISATPEIILDFFQDRLIVITKRRNLHNYILSLLFALETKLFHARDNNHKRYLTVLEKGVIISDSVLSVIPKVLENTKLLWQAEKHLKINNFDYKIFYYEDLNSEELVDQAVTNILGTPDWKSLTNNNIPISVEKDYTKCVLNYDQIVDNIQYQIKISGLQECIDD